jgi:hypothetical protein
MSVLGNRCLETAIVRPMRGVRLGRGCVLVDFMARHVSALAFFKADALKRGQLRQHGLYGALYTKFNY